MVKVEEAEDLRISYLIETARATQAGSRVTALTPMAQAAHHVPPAPTYIHNPQEPRKMPEVLANHETITVDDSMFYFAFGVEPHNLHRHSMHHERVLILQGRLKQRLEVQLRLRRGMAALEIFTAFHTSGKRISPNKVMLDTNPSPSPIL
jgi:hypothetical protein